MLRTVRLAICIFLLLIVQTTVLHRFSSHFISFDLLCILVAFVALETSFGAALWTGFAVGLIQDLASAGPFGLGPLLYVSGTALLVLAGDRLMRETFLIDVLLVFTFLLYVNLGRATGASVGSPGPELGVLSTKAIGAAAFSTAAALFLFPVFRRVGLVSPPESAPA